MMTLFHFLHFIPFYYKKIFRYQFSKCHIFIFEEGRSLESNLRFLKVLHQAQYTLSNNVLGHCVARNSYCVSHFEWQTSDMQLLYRDIPKCFPS